MVTKIYKQTKKFPEEEKFGLIAQMRRSAISVPPNIGESATRKNDKEYIQFLYISLSSLAELETQLIISSNLGYTTNNLLLDEVERLIRSLLAFIKYLKNLKLTLILSYKYQSVIKPLNL